MAGAELHPIGPAATATEKVRVNEIARTPGLLVAVTELRNIRHTFVTYIRGQMRISGAQKRTTTTEMPAADSSYSSSGYPHPAGSATAQ